MSRMNLAYGLASVLAFTVIAAPAASVAQVCASNSDCGKGMTCQASSTTPSAEPGGPTGAGGSSVSGAAPAPTVPCDKGTACDTSLVAPTPAPRPGPTEMTCQMAACQADSDCAGDMVCQKQTITSCSGSSTRPCPADVKCDADLIAPTPPICTETTTATCAFKWQLPCNADVDCGADFVCVPWAGVSCGTPGVPTSGTVDAGTSGSVGAGGASGGSSDPAPGVAAPELPGAGGRNGTSPPVVCTPSVPTFPGYCEPKATTCTADSDCPARFTCVNGSVVDQGSGGGVGGSPPVRADGGVAVTTPEKTPPPDTTTMTTTTPPAKVCSSPYYFGGGRGVATDSKNGGTVGTAVGTNDGVPPPRPVGPTAGPGASESASGGNSGCAVAGPVATMGVVPVLGLLAVAGAVSTMLAGARRRRRFSRRND